MPISSAVVVTVVELEFQSSPFTPIRPSDFQRASRNTPPFVNMSHPPLEPEDKGSGQCRVLTCKRAAGPRQKGWRAHLLSNRILDFCRHSHVFRISVFSLMCNENLESLRGNVRVQPLYVVVIFFQSFIVIATKSHFSDLFFSFLATAFYWGIPKYLIWIFPFKN